MIQLTARLSGLLCASLLWVTLFSACDSNRLVDDTPDGNISIPDDDVVANVGPSSQLVTEHVLAKANSIRSSIADVVSEEFGGGTGFEPGTFLVQYAAGPDDNTDPLTAEVDISEDIRCDDGGSRNVIGFLTFIFDDSSAAGSYSGTFTITYDNCEDIALMEAANGNCAVTPAINGEISSTISGTFSIGSNFNDSQSTNDTTSVSANTIADLNVTIDNNDSEQGYFFEYALRSNSTNDNLDGNVSFDNLLYDINDVRGSVELSQTSVVCP